MYLMEAIGGLQHVQVLIDLIVFTDELVAEHAQALLPQLLHLLVDRGCPLLLVRAQESVHVVCLDVALTALTHILAKFGAS